MRYVVVIMVLVFAGGCASVPRVASVPRAVTLEGLCGKYAADCSWDGISQAVTMHYRGQKIRAMVGSSIVVAGGTKMVLSAPLKRSQGAVIVPADFEKAVFAPALDDMPAAAGSWTGRVVIDVGHGGKDPGAIGFGGVKEKDIVLDIGSRLVRILKRAGIDTVLTRTGDDFISLARRTEIASQAQTDLFISIHANAHKSRRAHGVEVYSAGPLNTADAADAQRDANVKKMCSKMNMHADADVREIVADMLYAHKVANTPALAAAVSREMARVADGGSRGSKTARFFVLRNTLVPAVLVEVGFISNPKEALQLKEGAYRQRIADAIAKGVMRCLNAAGN